MRRFILIFLLVLAVAVTEAGRTCAESEMEALMPPYWIVGTLPDLDVLTSADGRVVDFYRTQDDLDNGRYAQGVVSNNRFMLNAFAILPATLEVGATYNVATEQSKDTYGAKGTVTISGGGWDEVKDFSLTLGGGISTPPVDSGGDILIREVAPAFNIWIGNRLYQKALVEKGEKFVVSSRPDLIVDISIEEPFTLSEDIGRYSIVLDQGTPVAKNLVLTPSQITQKVYAAGTAAAEEKKIKSFRLQYLMADALTDGPHTFVVAARSSGKLGVASAITETITVEVMGGPLRIVGAPLAYPNPFSSTKNKTVTIQYALSQDADIQILLVDITGERIKNLLYNAKGEGGAAGINKVIWDGSKDTGAMAGNGIYLGTVISRGDGKSLGTFKLAIVD